MLSDYFVNLTADVSDPDQLTIRYDYVFEKEIDPYLASNGLPCIPFKKMGLIIIKAILKLWLSGGRPHFNELFGGPNC